MNKPKLVTKPVRPAASSDAMDAFVAGAPDSTERALAQAPAAAQAPAPAAVAADVPRALRKRKEPITVTVDPSILDDFDQDAAYLGLSRAGALGMAMKMWSEEQRKRRGAK